MPAFAAPMHPKFNTLANRPMPARFRRLFRGLRLMGLPAHAAADVLLDALRHRNECHLRFVRLARAAYRCRG